MKTALVVAASALAGVMLCGCGGTPTAAPTDAPTTAAPTDAPPYLARNVTEAWANQGWAHYLFDVDRVMLDYDDESIIATYNDNCVGGASSSGYTEIKGTVQIRKYMEDWFAFAGGRNHSKIHVPSYPTKNPIVEEFPGATVFLVWTATGVGIAESTATYFWKRDDTGRVRIAKESHMYTAVDEDCTEFGEFPDVTPGKISDAWNHHLQAFEEGNATLILTDYHDEAVIHLAESCPMFKHAPWAWNNYVGLSEIGGFWDRFFLMNDWSVTVRLVKVEPELKNVLLAWKSGKIYSKSTASFLFDDNGKIVKQNIFLQEAGCNERMGVSQREM